MMASAVCIGGPSSAAAIASAKGWRALLIPGLLCGSLGYAMVASSGSRWSVCCDSGVHCMLLAAVTRAAIHGAA